MLSVTRGRAHPRIPRRPSRLKTRTETRRGRPTRGTGTRAPLAVVGLPRITPAALAAFEASRAAAEKAALAAAAAAEAKAAKAAKGKKPPAKKPGKAADAKDAEDANSGSIAVEKSSRFAAGLFSGDDLVKAAAGVDPNPFVYVPPPEEEDAKK